LAPFKKIVLNFEGKKLGPWDLARQKGILILRSWYFQKKKQLIGNAARQHCLLLQSVSCGQLQVIMSALARMLRFF